MLSTFFSDCLFILWNERHIAQGTKTVGFIAEQLAIAIATCLKAKQHIYCQTTPPYMPNSPHLPLQHAGQRHFGRPCQGGFCRRQNVFVSNCQMYLSQIVQNAGQRRFGWPCQGGFCTRRQNVFVSKCEMYLPQTRNVFVSNFTTRRPETLWSTLSGWVLHKKAERSEHLKELAAHIHWPLMEADFRSRQVITNSSNPTSKILVVVDF